jgi:CBS domain containing-hemolysin-like protein
MESIFLPIFQQWEAIKLFFDFDTARLAEPDMIVRLGIQVVLLCSSAFFSGSETALFSLSRLDLQKLRRERNRHTETLHELLDQPRRLIISILCGNELVNIAAAANMTGILVVLYGVERAGWISILVMVPLLLLFGEVTPKTISVSNPVRVSTGMVATPMSVWVRLVAPLVWVIRGIADRITTLIVGEEKAAENILQLDEFRTLVEEVAREGELNATERALIYNLLEAGDTEVVEIMTPRTRTAFLNADMTVPEMVERFRDYRHPRVPVFRTHRDNLVGFVHAEDILRLVLDETELTTLALDDVMHSPVVVPLTKKVDEMFDFFTANNARAAAVLNEFGGVEGFVTMKDVLTFIFGQISGDVEGQELYHERDEDSYEVDGDMKLTDFNNLSNFGIEDPRMTTVGGVAFRHLDRLPRVGDSVTIEDIGIDILEMDEHRIARVRVSRGSRSDETVEAGASAESVTAEAPADELHDDKMAGSDDDENIMADSQPANDEAGPESVRAGDANSNPDHKVIY